MIKARKVSCHFHPPWVAKSFRILSHHDPHKMEENSFLLLRRPHINYAKTAHRLRKHIIKFLETFLAKPELYMVFLGQKMGTRYRFLLLIER